MANFGSKAHGQRPNKTILSRTLILMIVCGVVAFSVLAIRLGKLMISDHDYYEQRAVEQQTRSTTVKADRGTIYDANGNVLAMSATAYTVFISPYEIEYYSTDENSRYGDDPELIAQGLSEILGVEYDSIMEMMEDTSSWYKTVATKIDSELADQVREFKSENDIVGIHIENDSKRYYPYGDLACHVIGFVGTDNYGLEGIEAQYNEYLEGVDGSIVRLTTNEGTEMLFENYENYNDAVDGADITLTLDATIQNIAEKYLQQAVAANDILNGGCCIVMNVKTGEILAMANANGYDLNSPWTLSEDVQAEIDAITDDEERSAARTNAQLAQWRNMAISDTYEPGSVFKIITLAMGLDSGTVSENDNFYCGGSMQVLGRGGVPLNCWKHAGHGNQNLREAAMHSCNVAFVNIGLQVGAEAFYNYVEAFGLWNKTGIDLAGETSTRGLWWSDEVFKDPNNLSQLAAASFGQTFNVTPIQMITAVAAAVNGGYLMEPYLVSEITDASGEVIYSKEPTVVRQVISQETSALISNILDSVVNEEGGTGSNAAVAGYSIGGKTGTTTKTALEAQGITEYMVSFCGVAPTDDPEIAVLLVLDNPSGEAETYISGGAMAAPYVGKIMSEVLPYIGVEPVYSDEEEALLDVTVPSVRNQSIGDAQSEMAEMGLNVDIVGDGDTVTDQLPAAGSKVAAGSTVILYAEEEASQETVTVPNLYGMTMSQAQSALEARGLFLSTSGAPATDSNVVVSQQSVANGQEVPYGTVVEVTMIDSSNLGMY